MPTVHTSSYPFSIIVFDSRIICSLGMRVRFSLTVYGNPFLFLLYLSISVSSRRNDSRTCGIRFAVRVFFFIIILINQFPFRSQFSEHLPHFDRWNVWISSEPISTNPNHQWPTKVCIKHFLVFRDSTLFRGLRLPHQ